MEREREKTERTSVTLPASLAARLAYEAKRSRRSASAIVREALSRYLSDAPDAELPSFVGAGASGSQDTSERVDEVITEILQERFPQPGAAER